VSTTHTAAQAHVLVRRQGPRPGSWHAAVPLPEGFRTACGETLTDGPRGLLVAYVGPQAMAQLRAALKASEPVCRRCDRVGVTVAP
jgi:hypothetical protein